MTKGRIQETWQLCGQYSVCWNPFFFHLFTHKDVSGDIDCEFNTSGKDLCGYFDASDFIGQSAATFWHLEDITYGRLGVNDTYFETGRSMANW